MDRDDKSSNIIKLTGIKKLDPLVDYQKTSRDMEIIQIVDRNFMEFHHHWNHWIPSGKIQKAMENHHI